MAKRRSRGQGQTVSRAELKAFERRAASVDMTPRPIRPSVADERLLEPITADTGAPRRGVLPPRVNRVAGSGPTLTREQELSYIRADLRRLATLTAAMIVLIIVLSVVIPLLGL